MSPVNIQAEAASFSQANLNKQQELLKSIVPEKNVNHSMSVYNCCFLFSTMLR